MEVGIVNMYDDLTNFKKLVKSIESLGYKPHIIEGKSSEEVYNYIKGSSIKHWIFSGSDIAIVNKGSPQVSMKLFKLNKKIMCLCYSMESVIVQLGYTLKDRKINITENFILDLGTRIKAHRNHRWYFDDVIYKKPLYPVAFYKGELMMALYKNAVLMQFHPERTADGKKLIHAWLSEATKLS